MPEEEAHKAREFIEGGSEIAGGVAAAAVGLIAGGPPGALVGGAAGPIITRILRRTCAEIYERVTGHRERARGGAVAAYAVVGLQERLGRGDAPRDDGFFNAETDRSSADELFEGVVLKSRNDHQEKKLRFYGNIFVTAAFDRRFTPDALNHSLAVAERLTYRQLCLLHLFSRPQPIPLLDADYRGERGTSVGFETVAVLAETFDLYQASLVRCHQPDADQGSALLGMSDIHPSWMIRTTLGDRLHYLMQLQSLPDEDLAATVAPLRG